MFTAGHFSTQTSNHTFTWISSLVDSLNTTSRLWCAANSLTLCATRIGLFVRAPLHLDVVVLYNPRRQLLAAWTIVVVSSGPATICPTRSNPARQSLHRSQHKSLSCFASFRSTLSPSDVSTIQSPRLASSTPPTTQTAPKPNCGSGSARVSCSLRSRVATSSSLLSAQLLEMEACNVVVVGQCTLTHSSVLHSVTRSESGSKRQDTKSHSTHSVRSTQPSPENTLYKGSLYNQ